MGGIGIVVIALVILPFLRIGGMQLFHLEGDDPYDKFLPKISSVVKKIVIVYAFLTAFLFILYYLNDMTLFDAIAHSLTTISTGGFSTHNESFAYFQSNTILNIAIIFMILGSIPFLILAQISFKNLTSIFKDHQIRLFISILIVAIILIFILLALMLMAITFNNLQR